MKKTDDDPTKRIWKRENLDHNPDGVSTSGNLTLIEDLCGSVLEVAGYDKTWPPTRGENVFSAPEAQESPEWYAALTLLHCKATRSAIEQGNANDAAYNALAAGHNHWVSYFRATDMERRLWSGAKFVRDGGRSRDSTKNEKKRAARELVDRYNKLKATPCIQTAYARLAKELEISQSTARQRVSRANKLLGPDPSS